MYSTLVIEDDYIAFLSIEKILAKIGFAKIDNVSNIEDLDKKLQDHSYDLIVCDLILEDGRLSWEYLKSNPVQIPIIFTTILDDSHLFKEIQTQHNSLFLVKPVNELTLESAVLTLLPINENNAKAESSLEDKGFDRIKNTIFFRSRGEIIKMNLHNILFLKAEGNYCRVQMKDRKYIIRSSFSKILDVIDNPNFTQVHRSYILNIAFLDNIVLRDNSIHLSGWEIPIGRKYKQNLLNRL